jgi:hypothetical protein
VSTVTDTDAPPARRSPWAWAFQSRTTGRTTIVQWPNAPLWVWIASTLLRRLTPVSGGLDDLLRIAALVGLAVWAALEVWSGVNPWRRLLGLGGLASVASTLLS